MADGKVEDKSKPMGEYIKDIGRRGYRITKTDDVSLKNIEKRLTSGKNLTVNELSDYQDYLDGISQNIRSIIQMEKAEGIANMGLEGQLRKIVQMLNQVTSMLDKF